MIIFEPGFSTWLWEEADMRLMVDDYGDLVFVPFCYNVWQFDAFEIL